MVSNVPNDGNTDSALGSQLFVNTDVLCRVLLIMHNRGLKNIGR